MRKYLAVAAALAAIHSTAALAADGFKGRMKPGLYEMKMTMEIPGMPAGMGPQTMTFQNCVTEKDLERGELGKQEKNQTSCEMRDMKTTGNTATYKMVCKEPAMTSDVKITWRDNGYVMDMRTNMKDGGQSMNMTQKMEGTYKGPCK